VYVPALVGAAFVLLPLVAILAKVDWADFGSLVTSEDSRAAFWLSLKTSSASTGLCLLFGVPMAMVLARRDFPGLSVLRSLVLLPLVLPPVVGGLALLYTFGRRGLLGGALDVIGVQVAFSTIAVVMAQTFVALPFLVLAVEGAVRTSGVEFERTAAALGASRWTILRRITLPLAAPGIVAGVVLCFARAIGEFGATALFAGNRPGVTQTMPLAIYTAFNGAGVSQGTAVALSLLLLVTAVGVLLLVRAWRAEAPR